VFDMIEDVEVAEESELAEVEVVIPVVEGRVVRGFVAAGSLMLRVVVLAAAAASVDTGSLEVKEGVVRSKAREESIVSPVGLYMSKTVCGHEVMVPRIELFQVPS
jgi:hypothetical protein